MLGAVAGLAVGAAAGVGSARAQGVPVVATDLEVVTVTDTSAVLTWTTSANGQPVATATEVRLGPADATGAPPQVFEDPEPTPFHYAEIDGLEPGRRYKFEAWSQGARATPAASLVTGSPGTPEVTGEFTTLVPPAGRLLRTIALANDVHYGEEVSGLLVGGFPPGFRQVPHLPPYPDVMLDALLGDARARGVDTLLVAGDLTDEARPGETRSVREKLDTWGTLGRDWFAVRGNHDRPHRGEEYAACTPLGEYRDCFGDLFAPRQQSVTAELGGLRLVGLDTADLDGAGGRMDPAQLDHLDQILRADPDRPTLMFSHHPVTIESGLTNIAGPGFVLDGPSATALQRAYERAPGVFLHHSGHTHRNRRTRPDANIAVEFLEVAAVKEYPGGYGLLRIYEGGYMVNFHKTRTAHARQWSATTRGQYFGLLPEYALGAFADRNHVVARDFSGLR